MQDAFGPGNSEKNMGQTLGIDETTTQPQPFHSADDIGHSNWVGRRLLCQMIVLSLEQAVEQLARNRQENKSLSEDTLHP
jgi:hypothetical protein